MSFLSVIFNLFYLVLFGSMFSSGVAPALDPYGGDFISYILIGSIGWGFLWSIMSATSSSLSTEMMLGTLESILVTRTKLFTMMVSYTVFGSFFGLLSVGILLLVGYFLFGVSIFASATIYTLIIFLLSTTMMMGFGMIFGGLTIWLKNIGETVPLLQSVFMFFCGVYFPITILPIFLQPLAKYLPFYYSIEGLRRSLIPSTPVSEMLSYAGILLVSSILFIALGIIVLHICLIKAKREGSLTFY